MSKYVVYKVTNTVNGKIYIGMTNNIKTRWSGNGTQYRTRDGNLTGRPFWNAIQKYGWENFKKEILISDLSMEEALEKERELIKTTKANIKGIGYNVSPGGNGGVIYKTHPRGMLGKHHTEENKTQARLFMLDRNNNPMFNGKTIWGVTHPHPRGMLGKHHTEEKKKQISETLKRKGHAKKKIKAVLPSGEVVIYDSLNECCEELGLCNTSPMTYKLLKTNEPYKLTPYALRDRKRLKKLEGLTLEYLDNTEVTK